MCSVEVEKTPKLQTACTLVAVEGMVVKTDTPQVHKARKDTIEFLLRTIRWIVRWAIKARVRIAGNDFRYGLNHSRFNEEKLHHPEESGRLWFITTRRDAFVFRRVRVLR